MKLGNFVIHNNKTGKVDGIAEAWDEAIALATDRSKKTVEPHTISQVVAVISAEVEVSIETTWEVPK